METKVMRLSEIKPAEYNPRVKLSEKDFEYKALRESITQFGLVVPLIVNERTGNLVGGHQRLSVLLEQGVEETEVVVIDVDEAREKAICVAMNKISGQWDYGKLADLLEELRDSADVDTLVTGFSDNEIGISWESWTISWIRIRWIRRRLKRQSARIIPGMAALPAESENMSSRFRMDSLRT